MATRRREGFPGKERATAPPQTQTQTGGGASKLKGAINQISKPKVVSTKVSKPAPAASKAPTNTIIHGVSKPQTKVSKPATSTTATKTAQTRSRPLNNKTPTPTPKARVSATATATAAAPRSSSSLPVRTVAPVKTRKLPVAKEELGKRRLSNASAGSGRRSSTGCKTKEISVSAAKKHKHIISDKNEDVSMHSVPEPAEMKIQDTAEYSYLAEADNTVQSLSDDFEKGIYDIDVVVREEDQDQDQELLSSTKIEDMINHADPTLVTGESTVEKKQELEHDLNKVEKTADSSYDDAKEKEVKMVGVAEEVMRSNADDESTKEIENPAVDKKEKMHGNCKHDSPVSNDVIEETATKLREMRKNKVRALAGAFETVISLQDK